MAKEIPWRKAIEKVLSDAPTALHYKDVTDRIISDGLRKSLGATPSATVRSLLATGVMNEGSNCPFRKVGRGMYEWQRDCCLPSSQALLSLPEEEEEAQYEIITSFGMFWRKDAIDWCSTPKILGMQQIGAEAVNFFNQRGIYLLYDGREVIYVGRTTDRALGQRLYEHTKDRLSARWDRFSWFGLLPISEEGKLGTMTDSYQSAKLIPAIEAILIEALEPRQNRKRGDDLSAVEYIQEEDPEIKKKKTIQSLDQLLKIR